MTNAQIIRFGTRQVMEMLSHLIIQVFSAQQSQATLTPTAKVLLNLMVI